MERRERDHRDRSSVYHRYHPEIVKRTAPALRNIAKKRKKKEKEDRENTARLAKLKEVEVQVQEKVENIPPAPLSNNRISSPLPDPVPKQSTTVKINEPPPRNSVKRRPIPPAST
jgi:hypothetical protein